MWDVRHGAILLGIAGLAVSIPGRADHPLPAFGAEGGGTITTITATPLPRGQVSTGIRMEYVGFDRFSDSELESFAAAGREGVHSVDSLLSTTVALAWGVSDDLTLSARIARVGRRDIREGELEAGIPEAHEHGDSTGMGDLVLFGQYRFLDGATHDAALLAGIKAPTGTTDASDLGAVQEMEFQPGSGSWDALFGAAVSHTAGRTGVHVNILYQLTTEGDRDTELGNAFFYNAGISRTLARAERHSDAGHDHTHLSWDAILELNGESRGHNRYNGVSDGNSGGDLVFLSPGLRFGAVERWSLFLSVGIPVYQDLNGTQTDVDYRVIGGFGITL